MSTREGGTGPKAGRHTSVNPPPQPLGATVEPIREICVPAGSGVEVTPYVEELVRSWYGFRVLCSRCSGALALRRCKEVPEGGCLSFGVSCCFIPVCFWVC